MSNEPVQYDHPASEPGEALRSLEDALHAQALAIEIVRPQGVAPANWARLTGHLMMKAAAGMMLRAGLPSHDIRIRLESILTRAAQDASL